MKRLCCSLLLTGLASVAQAGDLNLQVSDAAGKPLAYAVVWLKPANGVAPAAPAHASHAIIDQVARRFTPLVTVLRTGTLVDFPNSDNIRHSVYSFSPARTFTLKLYSGKPSDPVLFDKEGFITLGCNIHDQMIAWVVAVDTPWFAQSTATGSASIAAAPDGEYLLSAWHPGLEGAPLAQRVRVEAKPATLALRLDARPVASLLPDSEGHLHTTMER